MLRNRRGATSLRWLRALLDHGIEVHGQVVVCPGRQRRRRARRHAGRRARPLPRAGLAVRRAARRQPLQHRGPHAARTPRPRPPRWSTASRTGRTCSCTVLGRRLVFAADEYYLLADRPFPAAEAYEGFPMHEDGIGMARTFELELFGAKADATGDAGRLLRLGRRRRARADADYEPYRGHPGHGRTSCCTSGRRASAPVGDPHRHLRRPGARPRWSRASSRADVRVVPVENQFFGGTTGVTGLLVGEDLARMLAAEPEGHRYLLPDVCLSNGRFLDGTTPEDLPRPVEVVATDGHALRAALGLDARRWSRR